MRNVVAIPVATGRIDLHELLDYVELPNSSFARRTFKIFDDDNSGSIDFREFVLTLWNFCSCSDSSLRMFAFDLYDQVFGAGCLWARD